MSAQARREQLLAAAFRVMERDGVAAATTRAIVSEASMSLGAFHYCFSSKQELFRQLFTSVTGDEAAMATSALRQRGEDFSAQVLAAMEGYWQHVRQRPNQHLVLYELTMHMLREPGMRDLAERQYQVQEEGALQAVRAVSEATGVRFAVADEAVARLVASFLDGETLRWLIDRDDDRTRAAFEQFCGQLNGLVLEQGGSSLDS